MEGELYYYGNYFCFLLEIYLSCFFAENNRISNFFQPDGRIIQPKDEIIYINFDPVANEVLINFLDLWSHSVGHFL